MSLLSPLLSPRSNGEPLVQDTGEALVHGLCALGGHHMVVLRAGGEPTAGVVGAGGVCIHGYRNQGYIHVHAQL